jgi:hypothetical protein
MDEIRGDRQLQLRFGLWSINSLLVAASQAQLFKLKNKLMIQAISPSLPKWRASSGWTKRLWGLNWSYFHVMLLNFWPTKAFQSATLETKSSLSTCRFIKAHPPACLVYVHPPACWPCKPSACLPANPMACLHTELVFLNLMEPRNRCQGINSASLCSPAGRYDNPIPTRCLAPIDFLKIPALNTMNSLLPAGLRKYTIKGVGRGPTLAWPGWKQPDISVKVDTARLEAGQFKKCCMECVLLYYPSTEF